MLWASIKTLFGSRCPAAVAEFVVSVVVAPVDLQSGWALAHVGKKIFKDQPSAADGYSSSAIILEGFAFLVEAPLLHSLPDYVSRCTAYLTRVPMFTRYFSSFSTTAAGQLWKFAGYFFHAAVTANPPAIFYGDFGGLSQDDKATETQARDVGELRHRGEYDMGKMMEQAP